MSISYEAPAALFDAIATLRIVCPRHDEDVLIDYCRNAIDDQVFIGQAPGYRVEYVGYMPTDEEREAIARVGLGVAVSAPADGDEPHWRAHLECTRPSCEYDAQLRLDNLQQKADALLARMVDTGARMLTVTSVDADWRVVTT